MTCGGTEFAVSPGGGSGWGGVGEEGGGEDNVIVIGFYLLEQVVCALRLAEGGTHVLLLIPSEVPTLFVVATER